MKLDKMKHLMKFENYIKDLVLPPTKYTNNDDSEDDDNFYYDFKIVGMRFSLESIESIKKEVDVLSYDYNKSKLNKFYIDSGVVCFKVKNYYYHKNEEMLNMDVFLKVAFC